MGEKEREEIRNKRNESDVTMIENVNEKDKRDEHHGRGR
jgi:hypothetical protein